MWSRPEGLPRSKHKNQQTHRRNAHHNAKIICAGNTGRYRANNDLLFYHLDVRIDPEKQRISGKNTIRFRMVTDDTRIPAHLYPNLQIDKILLNDRPLKYEKRDWRAVFVDFPETLRAGREYLNSFPLFRDANGNRAFWWFLVR